MRTKAPKGLVKYISLDYNGKKRFAEFRSFADYSKYYLPCEDAEPSYKSGCESELSTDVKSKYIPVGVKSIDHAYKLCREFKMPLDIQQKISLYSTQLISKVFSKKNFGNLRKQSNGRFDSRAMSRVMRDLHKGTFSAETTRPFFKRDRKHPKIPSVLILADGSYSNMWRDENYIPNMCILTYAIKEICTALGMHLDVIVANDSMDSYKRKPNM